jgi:hypothetical protein
MAYGTVKSEIGSAALGLGWTGVVILALVLVALIVMKLSIDKLVRLTEG